MNSHLTMPPWQQLLLLLSIPLVIGIAVVWWKASTMGKVGKHPTAAEAQTKETLKLSCKPV